MLKRLLVLLAVLAGLTAAGCATAWPVHGSGPSPILCPEGGSYVNGNGVSDGCAGADFTDAFWAPGITGPGQFAVGAAAAIQSGQPSIFATHPMPWNVAAFDFPIAYTTKYAISGTGSISAGVLTLTPGYSGGPPLKGAMVYANGVNTNAYIIGGSGNIFTISSNTLSEPANTPITTSPLVDVAVAATFSTGSGFGQMPPGCTWTTSGGANVYSCNGTNVGGGGCGSLCVFQPNGLDFSGRLVTGIPSLTHAGAGIVLGAAGGLTPTTLLIYIHDNYLAVNSITATGIGCGFDCGGNTYMINVEGTASTNWTRIITHNWFEGNAQPGSTACFQAAVPAPCTWPITAFADGSTAGSRTITYNAFTHNTQRPFTATADAPGAVDFFKTYYNYVDVITAGHANYAGTVQAAHGELEEQIIGHRLTLPLSDISFNVCNPLTWMANNINSACEDQTAGAPHGAAFTKAIFDNNTYLGNNSLTDTNCQVVFTGSVNSGANPTVTATSSITIPGPPVPKGSCTGLGFVLLDRTNPSAIPANTTILQSGTRTTFTLCPPPNSAGSCGTLSSPVSGDTLVAQYAYNNSAGPESISYITYGSFEALNNYIDPTGAGGCFGAPDPGFFINNGQTFNASIASGVITWTTAPSTSASGNIEGGEIYVNGVDTGAYVVSVTSNTSYAISSSTLTYSGGTAVQIGLFSLGSANFGSGDPAAGGNGNINLLTGYLGGPTIAGFIGNSFYPTVPGVPQATGCTGTAVP
jgi:hypothetical protein